MKTDAPWRIVVRACLCILVAGSSVFSNYAIAGVAEDGAWSATIDWPFVPVSAAQRVDGSIMTWSSTEVDNWPANREYTYANIFDPVSRNFSPVPNLRHDMFCAGTAMLEDGSVLASGGNPWSRLTSRLDGTDDAWLGEADMIHSRWYGTLVSLAEGDVFATFAKQAGANSELWQRDAGWSALPKASMATLLREQNLINSAGGTGTSAQWYAFMHLAPNGQVFHAGPTPTMHWFDTGGLGNVQQAGRRLGETRGRQFGSSVMFDDGRLLISGGADRRFAPASTASSLTIDISGSSPVVEPAGDMIQPRTFHNSVVLPNGEVLVVGGNVSGVQFSDANSALTPEIWNPVTRHWRSVAKHVVPRNYHSVALLLQDGRVLSAGGGLCGSRCSANRLNGEIFSPPYLFDENGNPAAQPTIEYAGAQALAGGNLFVQTDKAVERFTMIRLGSTTHGVNSDQRFFSVASTARADNVYELSMHGNPNVMVPGPWWLFALDSDGVPSGGEVVSVGIGRAADVAPVVPDIADRASKRSVSVDIDLAEGIGGDRRVDVVGLPPGLTALDGRVTGSPAEDGVFSVALVVESGGVSVRDTFSWHVNGDGRVAPAGDSSNGSGGGALFLLPVVLLGILFRRCLRIGAAG